MGSTHIHELAVFVGRFQPLHVGHISVVNIALANAQKLLVVLGSHDRTRQLDNPFTSEERIDMFKAQFPDECAEGRIVFATLNDQIDYQHWEDNLADRIAETITSEFGWTDKPIKPLLVGSPKNDCYGFHSRLKNVDHLPVPVIEHNATDIRKIGYSDMSFEEALNKGMLTKPVFDVISNKIGAGPDVNSEDYYAKIEPWFSRLDDERRYIEAYKDDWANAPYPVTILTVDAVVAHGDKVLLVKRGARPGLGKWALPGGHLDQDELWDKHAAIRELVEETQIVYPVSDLAEECVGSRVCDDPKRSSKGRVITRAFFFDLQSSMTKEAPVVLAADDAKEARWFSIDEIPFQDMHDDHGAILRKGLRRIYSRRVYRAPNPPDRESNRKTLEKMKR